MTISRMRRIATFLFLLLSLAAAALAAGPALTTVQDTLYKADGSRFTGTLFIDWKSFETGDHKNVGMQSVVATITNGILRVQLAPTTAATPAAWYQVRYNSDGRIEFTEYWSVPTSSTPIMLKDVRISSPSSIVTQPDAVSNTIDIAGVNGLSDELSARVVRGAGFIPSRTAVINGAGMLEAAVGNTYDCVRVDGTAGPCTSGSDIVPRFIDGESPAGAINGSNAVFTLANPPNPSASLMLFRNGVLQKPSVDYTLVGNTITFVAASIPAASDLIAASYRVSNADAISGLAGGALTGSFPAPSLAAGVVSDFNVVAGAGIAESKLALNFPTHANTNDPSTDQKLAMTGTAGAPSGSNRFVTDQDPRMTDPRTPGSHSLLGASHGDTSPGTPVRGDIIVSQGQGSWTRLALGPVNRCLMSNGADAVWNTCLFTGFTIGAIPFTDSTGSLTQNSSRLFWDNANRRLAVGNSAPSSTLHVHDAFPVTGATTLTVRSGAGQGLNPLQRWLDVNGIELARLDAQGAMTAVNFQTATTSLRAAWRDTGYSSDPGSVENGDAWFNSAENARKTREAGQTHTQPQILCGGAGTATTSSSSASLATCVVPAGLLGAGDRLDVQFDYSHQGTSLGFSIDVRYGAASLLTRAVPSSETLLGGSTSGGAYAGGIQWMGQTAGAASSLASHVITVAGDVSSDLTIDFRGFLSSAGTDSLTLRNFTVIRYPAQSNP